MSELATVPLRDLPVNYNTLSVLINTPTVPVRYRESKTGVNDMYAATLAGAELGVSWWTAIHQIYLVNGQAALQGQLMLALIYRAGHRVKINMGETTAVVECYRRTEDGLEHVGDTSFSVEDAARAELIDKNTYEKYPKTMLAWRAVSMAARFYFPDCILGIGYVPEEVSIDAPVEAIPGYVVNEDDGSLEMESAEITVVEILDAEIVDDGD